MVSFIKIVIISAQFGLQNIATDEVWSRSKCTHARTHAHTHTHTHTAASSGVSMTLWFVPYDSFHSISKQRNKVPRCAVVASRLDIKRDIITKRIITHGDTAWCLSATSNLVTFARQRGGRPAEARQVGRTEAVIIGTLSQLKMSQSADCCVVSHCQSAVTDKYLLDFVRSCCGGGWHYDEHTPQEARQQFVQISRVYNGHIRPVYR